jgi:pimeloyl-ACP methyl ester carboxylesterase
LSFAVVNGRRIEYRMIPGDAGRTPLVFLHEGLGSVALWRDFPDKVARRLLSPALVYSRFGYGQSDGLAAKRTPAFMHEEACDVLPVLLDQLGIAEPLLIGHSDGASIAILYAALTGRTVAGLALLAPHVIVEDVTVESIAHVRASYETTDLRGRLAKYHANVDDAFLGWADIWLDPAFRSWSIEHDVARIKSPMVVIQGEDDEYGTLDQLDRLAAHANADVSRLVLPRCGHSPHRDQEAAVIDAIAAFAAKCLRSPAR